MSQSILVRCKVCGVAGEAEHHLFAFGELVRHEWVKPPNGWWVALMPELHLRCGSCLGQR
jgi:hypothetical protein